MKEEDKLNNNVRNFIKNMSYSISSNLIALVISTLVVLIIPKLIGIEEYGYWQLYIFYSSYVGFLHFGWNDGVYLRYGGEQYEDLDKKMFFSQFIQLLISQILVGMLIMLFSVFIIRDLERGFILKMVVITMILVNTRLMLFYVLQATNRIKEFAKVNLLDRLIYIVLIILFILSGVRDYKLMIYADLIGKLLSFIFTMFLCRDIVFNNLSNFYLTTSETFKNINSGAKLMFANIASMLIIGIVRFGIEQTWDVATFGKVSLTLSISNMMMIFINAVGIIMFPILRRTSRDKLADIYSIMRDLLMVLLLGSLIIYFPLKTVIAGWLPQYAESLMYMAIAFPIFIYEGKMALLISTYLKTLRKEDMMLKINIVSMVLSLILTYLFTHIFVSLETAILNIVVLLAIRSVLAEIYLSKELNIKVNKDIILEVLLTIIFISAGWYINSWLTMLIYTSSYIIYLLVKKRDIINTVHGMKRIIRN